MSVFISASVMASLLFRFSIGCEDERDDCYKIIMKTGGTRESDALKKYCEKWRNDPAVKQCKSTCGFCELSNLLINWSFNRLEFGKCTLTNSIQSRTKKM